MSSQNFFFFTGPNTFSLMAEVRRWKSSFAAKHGSENLVELEGNQQTLPLLLDAVSTMPFVSEKRLVFVAGVPKITKDDLQAITMNQHPQTVLAVCDEKPDMRLSVVKEILKIATVKSFALWSKPELARFLDDQARLGGSFLEAKARQSLLETVGEDPWMLAREIEKLAAFSGGTITVDAVEKLAIPSGSQAIWKLHELIAGEQTSAALRFVRARLDRGEDPYGIWTILLHLVRNLSILWMARQSGKVSDRDVASATGLHILSVRSLSPFVAKMPAKTIRSIVALAAKLDRGLKTGMHHYSSESPEELVTLIERVIVEMVG